MNYQIMLHMSPAILNVLLACCLAACRDETGHDDCIENVPSSPRALDLTPFAMLNAGEQMLDSHAATWRKSRLVPEHFTETTLSKKLTGVEEAYYPRITRTESGTYILTYQGGGTTVNGHNVYCMTSSDLVTWTPGRILFGKRAVTSSQGRPDTRLYTNGYPLALGNGEVIAISSFRLLNSYSDVKSQQDHGISLRRSTDDCVTWSEEVVIYRGTNWEGQILDLEDGTLQVYFSESRPWISGGHSGTGMIWSADGGRTWQPDCLSQRIGNPCTVAREQYTHYQSGEPLYSYQMPGVIRLNDGVSYAGVFETRKDRSEAYGISFAWSDGPWTEIMDSDPSFPVVCSSGCGPADRKSCCWTGTAPTILQFPSGETVVGYHASYDGANHLLFRMGDSRARVFSSAVTPGTEHKGSWGQVARIGTHEMIAVNRDSYSPGNVGISCRVFALDHDIRATRRTPAVDGRNRDWAASDEALFVGGKQDAYATLRCSADRNNVYFLIEVLDGNLSTGDSVELFLAPEGAVAPSESCLYAKADWSGLLGAGYYSGTWPESSASAPGCGTVDDVSGIRATGGFEGTLDDGSDVDCGSLVEIRIPKDLLSIADGSVLVNLRLAKAGGGKDSMTDLSRLSEWLTISNL